MEHEYGGGSFTIHLIAGAAAGTAEHCGMFPIDTVKTHIQAVKPGALDVGTGSGVRTKVQPPVQLIQTMKDITSRSGVGGLFRGVTAVAAGAAPAHALYFATYEACKHRLNGDDPTGYHPIRTGAAGVAATLVSDAVLCPTDAVKQRMQLHVTPYRGIFDCIRTVSRREGVKAFYAGYTTTLVMNVPYGAVYFASYESLCRLLKTWRWKNTSNENEKGDEGDRGKEEDTYDPLVHCLAGGGAGTLAAAFTNPFDVARTRLQTQGEGFISTCHHGHVIASSPSCGHVHGQAQQLKYQGMIHTLKTIWKEEGINGYTRGIRPRMVFHSMSAAICWSVYEYIKRALEKGPFAVVHKK